jgi:hypothetical protein
VSDRANRYCILDGQHRYEAMKRLEIDKIPCYVVQCRNYEEEASVLVGINNGRRALSSFDTFHAELESKDPMIVAIDKFLHTHGLHIGDNNGRSSIRFVKRLCDTWKIDYLAAQRAILTQQVIHDKDPVDPIYCGLWYLSHHGVCDIGSPMVINKLSEIGYSRMVGILAEVRAISLAGTTPRTSAVGLLRILNKGRKKRLALPEV